MTDAVNQEENRDVAAMVIAGVMVAISLILGLVVSLVKSRTESNFIELGVQLPNITILAFNPFTQVITLVVLTSCAAMMVIKGLRMIGLCSWIFALFLYLGFWALALGLPFVKTNEHLGQRSSERSINSATKHLA